MIIKSMHKCTNWFRWLYDVTLYVYWTFTQYRQSLVDNWRRGIPFQRFLQRFGSVVLAVAFDLLSEIYHHVVYDCIIS